ncbi:uncharacterized protein LOC109524549 isoform X6 [Hippocampus comes]|uniref:uncharacterized protein LOC109524549 isoform X6 n=1 Tax=Hippocampus comes TaxID=109280 RepID=UPI00094E3ED1|nr:PREDICTED: uncharacterized protein LOC109524549 isoform X6 [Hippocampus comes]
MCAKSAKDEYREELSGIKEKNERRHLLDAVFKNPQILLHKADATEGALHLDLQKAEPHVKEEERSETFHIKEEEEEADITKFPLTVVIVKREDDEDQGQWFLLHPIQDSSQTIRSLRPSSSLGLHNIGKASAN